MNPAPPAGSAQFDQRQITLRESPPAVHYQEQPLQANPGTQRIDERFPAGPFRARPFGKSITGRSTMRRSALEGEKVQEARAARRLAGARQPWRAVMTLIADDLPALERPAKATSTPWSAGNWAPAAALSMKLTSGKTAHVRGTSQVLRISSVQFATSHACRSRMSMSPFTKAGCISLAATLVLISGAAVQSAAAVDVPGQGTPFADGTVDAGTLKAATCSAAMAPMANSTNTQWPKIAGQNATYVAEQLQLFKSGVRVNPDMLKMAGMLSDKDIDSVAVYFQAQTPVGGEADAAMVHAGENLYRFGDPTREIPACTACHGPVGRAVTRSPIIRSCAPQFSEYVVKQLNDFASGARYSGAKPVRADQPQRRNDGHHRQATEQRGHQGTRGLRPGHALGHGAFLNETIPSPASGTAGRELRRLWP